MDATPADQHVSSRLPAPLSWKEFRDRALAEAARHGLTPPDDEALAAEYIYRRGEHARLQAWIEVHQ